MKTVLITGGMGALASDLVELIKKDYKLVLVDILPEVKISSDTIYLREDITSGEKLEKSLHKLLNNKEIRLDGIVNTPAWHDFKTFDETSYENMKKAIETKLLGYANAIKASLPFLNKDASIINIASVHAHTTYEGYAMYAAANGGVISLSKALSVELKHLARINVVTPGGFLTPVYKKHYKDWKERANKRQVLNIREVSKVVAFLLSDGSSGINGSEIVTDIGVSNLRASSTNW